MNSLENKLSGRDNNFNFLRLFLALAVILSHSFELIDGNLKREPLTALFDSLSLGMFAVNSFFLLSGFLIVQSWDRKPILFDFLKNRVLRIYPAFIVASLLAVLIVGALGANAALYFRDLNLLLLLKNLILLRHPETPPVFEGQHYPFVNIPLWTIAYEFRCYLLVALFGLCGLVKNRFAWLGLFVAAFILFKIPALKKMDFFGSYFLFGEPQYFFRFLPYFFAGGCFYLFRDKIPYTRTGFVVAFSVVLLCFIVGKGVEPALIFIWPYVLFYLAFAKISILERFKTSADLSYGTYLYGWPIQKLLLWYIPTFSPLLLFLVASVVAVGCGLLSWKLVERPFLRMKRKNVVIGEGEVALKYA